MNVNMFCQKAILLLLLVMQTSQTFKAPALPSVHTVIFYDYGDAEAMGVTQGSQKLQILADLKSTINVKISTILVEKNILSLSIPFLKINKELPINFAMDLTKIQENSAKVKELMVLLKFPTISTNDWDRSQIMIHNSFSEVAAEATKYLIALRSPESLYTDVGMEIMIKTHMSKSYLQMGRNTRQVVLCDTSKKAIIEILNKKFRLRQLVKTNAVNTFFIIDSVSQIQRAIKGGSDYDGHHENLLNERNAWWGISTEVNEPFKCPDYDFQIVVVTPEFKQMEHIKTQIKKYKTNNLMQLYYIDVIQNAIQAYGKMKKDSSWKDRDINNKNQVYALDFRTTLKKCLTDDDNILGKELICQNGIIHPDIIFKFDLHTPKTKTALGTLTINDKNLPNFTILNSRLWEMQAAEQRQALVVVVQPPFVIRNDTCLKSHPGQRPLTCYSGYVMDILKLLNMNAYELLIKSEDVYGAQIKGFDACNGACGLLADDKADIGIGAFHVTEEMEEFVTFSMPFYTEDKTNKTFAFAFRKTLPPKLRDYFNYRLGITKTAFQTIRSKWFPKKA